MSNNQQKVIKFTPRSKEYSFLSNFYPSPLIIDGEEYWHVEGYYQAQKYYGINNAAFNHIRRVYSPLSAKRIAYSYHMPKERKDKWDNELKDQVMKRAVTVKFLTNKQLSDKLLQTGNAILIEYILSDSYWGSGKDGNGQNVLGQILTGVRSIIRGIYQLNNINSKLIEESNNKTKEDSSDESDDDSDNE